jgi:Zn-dependent peptidase ImmA (M78 family)
MKTISLHTEHFPLLKEFVRYCKEYLKLKSLPPLKMSYDPTTAELRRSFGGYDPNNKSIELSVANRHQADVFRTLAHELVHYKQDTQNRLTPESGKTGHDHENEANAAAAIIMRNFAQIQPEMFIVK